MSKAEYTLECGWASSNQVKAFVAQRLAFPKQKGILPADGLWSQTATLTLR